MRNIGLIIKSPWINDLKRTISTLSVFANGSVIIFSKQEKTNPSLGNIYTANGSLHREVMLSRALFGSTYVKGVIQRANENLILLLLMPNGNQNYWKSIRMGVLYAYRPTNHHLVDIVF